MIKMILVTTYHLPCGHNFTVKGDEPFPLKATELGGFWICPNCPSHSNLTRSDLIQRSEKLELV